jgi:8-oxo-dGTP pyrophosphatase MutT (NUDIX family)
MTGPIPRFGARDPGAVFVPRPGGHAVIVDARGAVAPLNASPGLVRPRGGQDPGASPEDAAVREARGEAGLVIALLRPLGVPDELVHAEQKRVHYLRRSTTAVARVVWREVVRESRRPPVQVPGARGRRAPTAR